MSRGLPRVQYERSYILVPPNANADRVAKITDWLFDYWRPTVGGSADDAGIGDLDVRRVVAVNPQLWGGSLSAFFSEYYEDVEYRPVEGENDFQLQGRLWSALLKDRLTLGYPTTNDQYRITAPFGTWRPDKNIYHNGVDMASAPAWGDEVLAAIGGEVVNSGIVQGQAGFGVQVRTVSTVGDLVVLCRYAHLTAGSVRVNVGDLVETGQVLGVPDSSGVSTGHHLHFDVKVKAPGAGVGVYIDPVPLIPELGDGIVDPPPTDEINRVGVHWSPVTYPPDPGRWPFWVNELARLGVGTVKLLHAGEPRMITFGHQLVTAGMRVIVRLYQGRQFPMRLDPSLMDMVDDWLAIGVRDFEIGNEPNLAGEWRHDFVDRVTWQDETLVALVARNWWLDANEVIRRGGRPAIYAMAPTDRGDYRPHPLYSSVEWLRGIMHAVSVSHKAEMLAHIRNGRIWLAVHVSPFNRPFDFDPGQSRPDDMCLRAFEVYRQIVLDYFGIAPEMVSTEGGVYSPEHLADLGWSPGYDEAGYARITVDCFDWLDDHSGPAICTWIATDEGVSDERWRNNGWYRGGNPRQVVHALEDRARR